MINPPNDVKKKKRNKEEEEEEEEFRLMEEGNSRNDYSRAQMARSDLCFIPFSTLFHVSCFIPVSFLQDRSFPLFPAILPPHPPSFAQMDKLQTLIESGNIPEILSYCEATELAVILLLLLLLLSFSIYLSIYLLFGPGFQEQPATVLTLQSRNIRVLFVLCGCPPTLPCCVWITHLPMTLGEQ